MSYATRTTLPTATLLYDTKYPFYMIPNIPFIWYQISLLYDTKYPFYMIPNIPFIWYHDTKKNIDQFTVNKHDTNVWILNNSYHLQKYKILALYTATNEAQPTKSM